MLVGLGGNNGTTLVATILANKHQISWGTRDGVQTPNYLGSLVRASTMRLGQDEQGEDVHVPMSDVLPMVHPNDLVVSFFLSSFVSSILTDHELFFRNRSADGISLRCLSMELCVALAFSITIFNVNSFLS